MAGYNRIIIMGNLTREPDVRQVGAGQSVCKLGIASNRKYKNKQSGQIVQEVCFIDVDVWGPQAESCRLYLNKGSAVLVEGRLKFDSWKDNDGQTRNRHGIVAERVVFLSGPSANDDISAGADLGADSSLEEEAFKGGAPKAVRAKKSADISFKDQPPFEDDLPF
jgi:single-strand DNA-binding protein